MNTALKTLIRRFCPNIPLLKDIMTKAKLKKINAHVMLDKDVQNGEKSDELKMALVDKYSKKWPGFTKELIDNFYKYVSRSSQLIGDKELAALKINVLFDCFAYGFMPDEYFFFQLEDKTPAEKRSYISDRDRFTYVYKLNDIIDVAVYFDKYATYKKFKKYYKRDAICISKQSDFKCFNNFVKKHPAFVQKNVSLSCGESVKLTDIRKTKHTIDEVFQELIFQGKCILEEKVVQSETMAKLNASSVNTVRCMTFLTSSGIGIGPCFLKVGQGNSFVDNGGAGGILIGIDNQTGILNTIGYDEFLTSYKEHPETHIKFMGYQLPEWNELLKLAKELSMQTPTVRYIGWDFAHTEEGWVIIEGNGTGQLVGPQIVWQKGFKSEIQNLVKGVVSL